MCTISHKPTISKNRSKFEKRRDLYITVGWQVNDLYGYNRQKDIDIDIEELQNIIEYICNKEHISNKRYCH